MFSKWIKVLTLKPITIKLLKENKKHYKIMNWAAIPTFHMTPKPRQQKQTQANRITSGQKHLWSKGNDWMNEETL